MGPDSCLGDGVDCYNVAEIVIGQAANVSQRAFLCTATHDHKAPSFPVVAQPINIGANAWVAAEAFVGPGVTVGEGAIIGARAVVVRDVASQAVVVGNPGRKIGTRSPASSQGPS